MRVVIPNERIKAPQNLFTVEQWLHWLEQKFAHANLYFGHGTDNAWDEAVQLLLYVMQLPMQSGREVLNYTLNDEQKEHLLGLVEKRIQGRLPLPYLTHIAYFAGLEFYVDERVLVPRSPFAEWINRKFSPWIDEERVTRILEIGTGSGCMAIAAALAFPHAQVNAVDISVAAMEVARINIDKYDLSARVHLWHSDCFDALPLQKYDVIMANPPYVGREEMETSPAEYHREPLIALQAEQEGLAVVEKILSQAHDFLSPQGILILEVGNQAEELERRYPLLPFTWLAQEHGGQGLCLLTALELSEYYGK